MQDLKVVMMGLGYIGLPTAALIAGKGIQVHGVDINPNTVDTINQGKIHIVEPDLEGLVHLDVQKGNLKADVKPAEADVFLIAVPTPFKGNNHEPDISYVESAARMIIPYLREGNLVILESTSPVGTTEKIGKWIHEAKPELDGKIFLAYCPERVLPGRILYELENNERAIGGIDEISTEKAVAFYSRFVKGQLHKTNARTAEMCKLVENSYRDVNIAFANELSMISDKAGINVWELINLANKHPRVNILQPGPGVGGHCIAVDPWFIVHDFKEDSKLIRSAREVNNYKAEWVIEKIISSAKSFKISNSRKAIVGCFGLAYKPDIDDLRESPALEIAEKLYNNEFEVLAVEPNIQSLKKLKLVSVSEALEKVDIVVLLVNHKAFQGINLSNKIVLDYCGVLNK